MQRLKSLKIQFISDLQPYAFGQQMLYPAGSAPSTSASSINNSAPPGYYPYPSDFYNHYATNPYGSFWNSSNNRSSWFKQFNLFSYNKSN